MTYQYNSNDQSQLNNYQLHTDRINDYYSNSDQYNLNWSPNNHERKGLSY